VICKREDVRDVFVSKEFSSITTLPRGARVGTSSLRRQSQLRAQRPDLEIETLRGNVNTRLGRLDAGDFDAIILAAAGLKRLGLTDRITAYLSPEEMLPAVGQGALALECRADDRKVQEQLTPLHDPATFSCVTAERALCKQLGGSCQVPVAAYAELKEGVLDLRGLVGSVDGTQLLRARRQGPASEAVALGRAVAEDLIAQGASGILKEFKA
jgi:hydroxymethylbilane synthase